MNKENMVEYGIQNEKSNIRVHVCSPAKHVYVYLTSEGRKAIATGDYPHKPAYQPGVDGPTAWGYAVPPEDIAGCKWYGIPVGLLEDDSLRILDQHSTTEKGERAEWIFEEMLKRRQIAVPIAYSSIALIRDPKRQVEGLDLEVTIREAKILIQVKCDHPGGHKDFGGKWGNLYLQTHERNPNNSY